MNNAIHFNGHVLIGACEGGPKAKIHLTGNSDQEALSPPYDSLCGYRKRRGHDGLMAPLCVPTTEEGKERQRKHLLEVGICRRCLASAGFIPAPKRHCTKCGSKTHNAKNCPGDAQQVLLEAEK